MEQAQCSRASAAALFRTVTWYVRAGYFIGDRLVAAGGRRGPGGVVLASVEAQRRWRLERAAEQRTWARAGQLDSRSGAEMVR